jgi:hypothetical protein
VETYSVTVVSPNVTEFLDESTLAIVTHLRQQIQVTYLQHLEDLLQSYHGQFSLKEVGSVKTVQTIRPHNSFLLPQDLVQLPIEHVATNILFHRFELLDNVVDPLEITT